MTSHVFTIQFISSNRKLCTHRACDTTLYSSFRAVLCSNSHDSVIVLTEEEKPVKCEFVPTACKTHANVVYKLDIKVFSLRYLVCVILSGIKGRGTCRLTTLRDFYVHVKLLRDNGLECMAKAIHEDMR